MKTRQWLLDELDRWSNPPNDAPVDRAIRATISNPGAQQFAARLAVAITHARPTPSRTNLPPPC